MFWPKHELLKWAGRAAGVLVAFSTVYVALVPRHPVLSFSSGFHECFITQWGWPLIAVQQITWIPMNPKLDVPPSVPQWDFDRTAVTVDLLVFLSLVSASFAVAYKHLRYLRFRDIPLSIAFRATITSAMLFVVLKYELDPVDEFAAIVSLLSPSLGSYTPITFHSWWVSLPVLYGVGCISFIATMLLYPLFHLLRLSVAPNQADLASPSRTDRIEGQ